MRSTGIRAGRLAVLIALASLAGCAVMSEQECRTADWREQGMRDALAGHPKSRLDENREVCAKVGVVPNPTQYMAGYAAGIKQFCTPENGARWGRDGHSYENACPPELEAAFLGRYRDGRRAYDADQTVRRMQDEQRTKQRRLDDAKDDAVRNRLRSELRDLDYRLRNARDDLDRAERNLRN